MLRRIFFVLAIAGLMLPCVVQAQDGTPKEAGKYERKSITYINALWLMDKSAHNLSDADVALVLDKIKSGIFMSRFDYNPVPQPFISDFVNQVNSCNFSVPAPATQQWGGLGAASDPMLDSITAIMERTVVPKVLEVVDLNKESRANNLTSEQQRNSFITNKAKMLGITMDDINKVMNSAYIFIPMIRNYSTELEADSSYSVSFDVGIIWFRISTSGDNARAIPVVRKFTRSTGFGKEGKSYVTSIGTLDYQHFAFRSAVKNAARNLVDATQEIPEFRLSGQVLEKTGSKIGFDLGKNEGVKLDDKYRIVEFSENADGKTVEKKNGWVLVTSIGDSSSKEGYKSKAKIIAGSPYTGAVLSEYPRLPLEIVVKGKMFAFSVDTSLSSGDSLSATNAYGFQVNAQYNIGRHLGINQLFFDFGFGLGFGSASGQITNSILTTETDTFESSEARTFEFSLVKKFYFGRCALVIQPVFGLQDAMIFTKKDAATDITYRYTNSSSGFAINGGLECALSPAFNFGLGVGYQMYGKNSKWDIDARSGSGSWESNSTGTSGYEANNTGLTAQIYFTWSPPGLPFDPWDAVRGLSGF